MADAVVMSVFMADDHDDAYSDNTDVILLGAAIALFPNDRIKVTNYVESVVKGYLPDCFQRMFRVSRNTFETLLTFVANTPQMQRRQEPGGRPQISIEKGLLMTLWYLGTQDTVRSISDRFDVQESTFICYNRKLLKVFSTILCKHFINWPKEEEKESVINDFKRRKDFPGVLGAIDGTHIRIEPPHDKQGDYINRKGFHSVILQAVCREDGRFTDIYCGWPGRVHDARVFRNSPLRNRLPEICGQYHIIGDGAYPLSRFLQTPYRDNGMLSEDQKLYNKALSGTRVIIEHCFGRLKGRFRRLQFIKMKTVKNMVLVIVAACVLHNICIVNHDELDEYFENEVQADGIDCYVFPVQDAEGGLKRLRITRQLANC